MEVCFTGRQNEKFSIQTSTNSIELHRGFYVQGVMLIIEVDGITHHSEEAIKKDETRQKALESAGFTVLRFSDEEVLNHIQAVHNYLEDWIEKKIDPQVWSTPN